MGTYSRFFRPIFHKPHKNKSYRLILRLIGKTVYHRTSGAVRDHRHPSLGGALDSRDTPSRTIDDDGERRVRPRPHLPAHVFHSSRAGEGTPTNERTRQDAGKRREVFPNAHLFSLAQRPFDRLKPCGRWRERRERSRRERRTRRVSWRGVRDASRRDDGSSRRGRMRFRG